MANDILFYDIEVFKQTYLAVFMDSGGNYHRFVDKHWPGDINDLKDVERGFEDAKELIKGKTLVGFNNFHYDDWILPHMLDDDPSDEIYKDSELIISGEKMNPRKYKRQPHTLDCRQQIDTSQPGLKKIEANLGLSVLESFIPFDKEDQLNAEEVAETFQYCAYDVFATSKVYKLREGDYFKAKDTLISMIDNANDWIKENAVRWNTTTIGAKVLLGDKKLSHWFVPSFNRSEDTENDKVKHVTKVEDSTAWDNPIYQLVPDEVIELWKSDSGKSITINDFDNEIIFGFGGIHSSNTKQNTFKNVVNVDVTSLYPNLIIKLGVLGEHTEKFKKLVTQRVGHKKTNPPLAAAEKIIINSVYGLMDSEYSAFFNHMGANAIRFYGQCILYDLARQISKYATIVQLNTDGMAFVPNDDNSKSHIDDICKKFMEKQGLNLETSHFDKFIQKDVNNYIGLKPDGHLKVKGKDVSRYEKNSYFRNNSTRIIDKGVVNYFIYDKSPEETVKENINDPLLFQFILQAGRTYKGTYDQNGKKYNNVNRVFAGKGENTVRLMKQYPDSNVDSKGKPKNPVSYASAPENMLVFDDTLENIKSIDNLDTDFYVDLIKHVISNWDNSEPEPTKKKSKKSSVVIERYDFEDFENNKVSRWANQYVNGGERIYPLTPGTKIPLKGTHGPLSATNNTEVLSEYWGTNSHNNIGLALKANNYVMLDLDIGHANGSDGLTALENYMTEHNYELPSTYTERTPSGGLHYFFQIDDLDTFRSATDILGNNSGIDIQADGTPVFPSMVELSDGFGQYQIINDDLITPLPDWLAELIGNPVQSKDHKKNQKERVLDLIDALKSTIDENRNQTLFDFGRLLQSFGIKGDQLRELIEEHNQNNLTEPIKMRELNGIIKSLEK